MRHLIKILSLGAMSCGPLVTEPMPDIPETVEYKTVRIEYGGEDLLPQSDARQQELVGDVSGLAALTKLIVRGANRAIRDQIGLVDAISQFRPSAFTDNSWTWEHQGERYGKLDLIRSEEDPEYVSYTLLTGDVKASAREVLSGEFTRFGREDGVQQGQGLLRFNLDADQGESSGRVSIAFRSAGGVRQVRVAYFDFREFPDDEPNNGLYEYVQLPNQDGTFKYGARQDFLKDGAPLEYVSITAAWNAGQEGRAAARVQGGSLMVNELLLDECWDEAGRVSWADAQPDLPGYDDGEFESCARALQTLNLVPPEVTIPTTDPMIPGPHSAE